MSDDKNSPTHIVYISTGKNKKTGKDNLSRVGALWSHESGNGYNLRLKGHSNNGVYIIFENSDSSGVKPFGTGQSTDIQPDCNVADQAEAVNA